MTPQEEATQILSEVLGDLTSPSRDLKVVLRRCQHACELLGWEEFREWFQQELSGYPADAEVPQYRRIPGQLIWRDKNLYTPGRHTDEKEDIVRETREGIDYLLAGARIGQREETGETEVAVSSGGGLQVISERVRLFRKMQFDLALNSLEQSAFNFASRSYTLLRYGNALSDIWTDYRSQVDATLQRLDLTHHLKAIESGLESDNSQAWRQAVWSCRDSLNDVANHLWRDPRKTYEYLQGADGKPMSVVEGKFANRLGAYVHQKGMHGKRGKFLRAEVERLAESIRALAGLQGKAHEPVSREEARLVAIATYLVLGELATKTDMQPIEQYSQLEEANQLEAED